MTAAVYVSSITVTVVGLALLGTSVFVVTSLRGFPETMSVPSTAIVTGASVVTSAVTSISAAFVSACVVGTDVFDAAVVSGRDTAVISGVVVSVTDSMNFLVSASVATVEAFVVTSVSTMTSIGTVFVVSLGTVIVGLVLSTTCLSVVTWAVADKLTSIFTFSMALVISTG